MAIDNEDIRPRVDRQADRLGMYDGSILAVTDSAALADYDVTWERVVPHHPGHWGVLAEHLPRYLYASSFTRGARVLDNASGTGYGADLIARSGASRVIATDVSPDALRYGGRAFRSPTVDFLACDSRHLALPAKSFDVALSFEALEHVQDPERYIAEVARVLTQDGVFIVSTPNRDVWRPRFFDHPFAASPYHVSELDLHELRRLIERRFRYSLWLGQSTVPPPSVGVFPETEGQRVECQRVGRLIFTSRYDDARPPTTRVTGQFEGSNDPAYAAYHYVICGNHPLDEELHRWGDLPTFPGLTDAELFAFALYRWNPSQTVWTLGRIEDELSERTRHVDLLQQQIQEAERRHEQDVGELQRRYSQQVADLQQGNEQVRGYLQQRDAELIEGTRAMASLQGQLSESRQTVERLLFQIRESEARIRDQAGRAATLQELVDELRTSRAQAVQAHDEGEARRARLAQALEKEEAHRARLAQALEEERAHRARVIQALEGQVQELQLALKDLTDRQEMTKARLDRAEVEKASQAARLSALQGHFDRAIGDLRALQGTRTVRLASAVGTIVRRRGVPPRLDRPSSSELEAADTPADDEPRPSVVIPPMPRRSTPSYPATVEIDRAEWRGGYLHVEGWAHATDSGQPPVVTLYLDGRLLGETTAGLSRPDIARQHPERPGADRSGFRIRCPVTPDLVARFVAPILSLQVRALSATAERQLSPPGPGDVAALGALDVLQTVREVRTGFRLGCGREPTILDWHSGLSLSSAFPETTVFSPREEVPTLPYLDRTVDLVVVTPRDPLELTEANRVASHAVVIIERDGAEGRDEAGAARGDHRVQVVRKEQATENPSPAVSIIIPTFNGRDHVQRCLTAIRATLPRLLPAEIIVVDDASTDDTAEVVRLFREVDLRFQYLRSEDNRGFIDTSNRGAEVARGELLVFLNNDTIPQPGWIEPLLETFAREPNAGAVGGKLLYPDGTLQEAGGVIFRDGSGANFGKGDEPDNPLYAYVREVDYCSGALLATPRALFWQVGGFDPHYRPAYYEDADYCFAVRKRGYRVYYQPDSRIVHLEGASAGRDLTSGMKRSQVTNRERFVARWKDDLAAQPSPPERYDSEVWLALSDRSQYGTIGSS